MTTPAAIDAATVAKVARLARLELQPAERASFQRDLERILGYFKDLQSVNTHDIRPMLHATGGPTPLREDATAASLGNERALANAPETRHQSFVVPKVIGA